MAEFEIDDEKIAILSRTFNVEERTVRLVYTIFTEVISGVKNQYLAHIIRCMESYIRKKTGNLIFQINCFLLDPNSPLINVGCAQYFPKQYFTIFFHPKDEIQLRVCLAHELGHLFIIEMANGTKDAPEQFWDAKTLTEPLSSIFGVFTIADKNNFNTGRGYKLNHHSWDDIVKDFIHLQNKMIH